MSVSGSPVEEIRDLIVEEAEAEIRLDVFLSRHLPVTRSEAAKAAEQGQVLVDGKERKASFKLRRGMRIHARIERKELAKEIEAVDIPLSILYEDPSLVVIDKPAGLVVHPGAGENDVTLVHALLHRYPEVSHVGPKDRPGIVHRLDKLTSGVMVVARTADAHEKLSAAFKAHTHTRIYLAICYGLLDESAGQIETFMQRNPKNRKKMSSKGAEGRRAVTDWQVLKEWDAFSLLELSLQTGRTHQIRVHLSDMGHPVVGDPEYGGRKRAHTISDPLVRSRVKALGRQMLHACKLGISHPATGEWMEFTSEPPGDFQELTALLDDRCRVVD